RLDALARVVAAKKVTPAAIRVQDVPGTGPALLGALRQVDALLVVLDGVSPAADPARDLENLKLELLVAHRDHRERRPRRGQTPGKRGQGIRSSGPRSRSCGRSWRTWMRARRSPTTPESCRPSSSR